MESSAPHISVMHQQWNMLLNQYWKCLDQHAYSKEQSPLQYNIKRKYCNLSELKDVYLYINKYTPCLLMYTCLPLFARYSILMVVFVEVLYSGTEV